MRIAIIEAFSGVAGDMMLGALIDLGLSEDWLRKLPAALGLDNVTVSVERVLRGEISSVKVTFGIPAQPHGRHLRQIREVVEASSAPDAVKAKATQVFEAITGAEATVHGTTVEKVHLHEVGAVDAILDIVGAAWGLHLLGVERVHCASVALGDGFIDASHGRLAVPAPATLRLLEGRTVHAGPEGSGELTTPTGAALVRVLTTADAPGPYRVLASGYGAGTRNPKGRANVVRIVLAEASLHAPSGAGEQTVETLAVVATDIDDMSGEYLAGLADSLREAGALDVTLLQTIMKKGRPGVRVEVLCTTDRASEFERMLLTESTTIGVRQHNVRRRSLPRDERIVEVLGQPLAVKVVALPGGDARWKPAFEDVRRIARATGRTPRQVLDALARLQA